MTRPRCWAPFAALLLFLPLACGRTPLDPGDPDATDDGSGGAPDDDDGGRGGGPGGAAGGRAGSGGRGGSGAIGGGVAGRGGAGAVAGASLEITPSKASIAVGLQQRFEARRRRNGAVDDVTNLAVWSIADTKIARLADSPSTFLGVAAGTTTVQVTVDGLRAQASLTVVDDTSFVDLQIAPAFDTIRVGETRALRAFAIGAMGERRDVTNEASWQNLTPSILRLSTAAGMIGVVTGAVPGIGRVAATFRNRRVETTITVVPNDMQMLELSVEPGNPTARVGETTRFTLIGRVDGVNRDFTGQATWTASDPKIATVPRPGQFVCQQGGAITVKATLPGLGEASATLTCSAGIAAVLRTTPMTASVPVGTKLQVFATLYFDDGTQQNVTNRATWTSLNPGIATVVRGGGGFFVTAVMPGTAVIEAAADGLVGKATITVTP